MSDTDSSRLQQEPRRLAQRLAQLRAARFVGRASYLDAFRTLIEADSPQRALFFHGLGGIGKSSLLEACRQVALDRSVPVRLLDLRDYAQSAQLRDALKSAVPSAPVWVLMLDTCERLQSAETELYSHWLPALPDSVRLVFAGRHPPGIEWRADPAWREAMTVHELGVLSNDESRALLRSLHVPDDRLDAAARCAAGHPLALTLVAQHHEERGEISAENPELLAALVQRFVMQSPSAAHRQALEICAHARVTTESLLRRFFEPAQAAVLLDWLAGLSFIERGSEGLFPHDLVRDTVDRELRLRDPERYRAQHRQISRHAVANSIAGSALDLMFLHRGSPLISQISGFHSIPVVRCRTAQAEDLEAVRDCVARHEGPDSARMAANWFRARPDAFNILVDVAGRFQGVLAVLRLDAAAFAHAPAKDDPACIAASNWLNGTHALRAGERIGLVRWWIGEGAYHEPSPADDAMAARLAELWLASNGVAADLLPHSRPQAWQSQMQYVDFQPWPEAGFTIDGRAYTVFGHDWRRVPLDEWLDGFRSRRAEATRAPPEAETLRDRNLPPRAEFDRWVRKALRDLGRPEKLVDNPLGQRVGAGNSALPDWLHQGLGRLEGDEGTQSHARILRATFFQECPSQEAAAERLNLPFGTYRHHLRTAQDALAQVLWRTLRESA
ncbi:MAG: hypothetical protein WC809_01690 [Sinimarinibacterium sp.]|jgi:hypothetical protein